jgi:hypothetical protein
MSRWLSATGPDRDRPERSLDSAWLRRLVERVFAPTTRALDRSETRVVAAFRAAHRAADRGSIVGSDATGSGRRVRERERVGRAVRIAFAAALVVVVAAAGGTAATGPGAPLYSVRLAVERTLLPGRGQPARLDAQLALVDRRLADAVAGLRRGDTGAATAALEAVAGDVMDIGRDATILSLPRREALERLVEDAALVRRLGGGLASSEAGREALEALRSARDELNAAAVVRDHRPDVRHHRPILDPGEGIRTTNATSELSAVPSAGSTGARTSPMSPRAVMTAARRPPLSALRPRGVRPASSSPTLRPARPLPAPPGPSSRCRPGR